MYLETILPVAEELKKRGHEILHNSQGGDVTLGSHLADLQEWHGKTPLVFLDHGVCPRNESKGDFKILINMNAYLLLSGKYYRRLLNKIDPSYKEYRVIGHPKLEYSLSSQVPRDEVIKKYQLDPGKPVILYAPTWYHKSRHNPYSHGTIKYLKTIEKACKEYNLILFPHSRDFKIKYLKYASHLKKEEKVKYYFSSADLLISDFSSVVIDFCYFNKPIIQITDIIDKNISRMRKNPSQYIKFQAGEFTKVRQLKKTVKKILNDPDKNRSKREKWFKDIIETVEGSIKLSADTIENYIK